MADRGEQPRAPTMRLDKFLWFSRLAKTRDVAQALAEARHLRIDGRVIDKAAAPVRVGDTLTFPLHGRIRVIRVAALPPRRGAPAEARDTYTDLAANDETRPDNVSQQAADD